MERHPVGCHEVQPTAEDSVWRSKNFLSFFRRIIKDFKDTKVLNVFKGIMLNE